jgi:hypothetical protein
MLVLLIPSKQTALRETPSPPNVHDDLGSLLRAAGVAVLDLNESFRDHADRTALFHRLDGHWNRTGMSFAAGEIQTRLDASARDRSLQHPVQ